MTRKNGFSAVEEINYGVYIWKDANGKIVTDSDYNYMCIPSKRGDQKNIKALENAARHFGVNGGAAEFVEGSRPISQLEWEEQKAREAAGEVADPYDLGNLLDEYKYKKEFE